MGEDPSHLCYHLMEKEMHVYLHAQASYNH